MKEFPILLKPWLAQAAHEGRKTQTRRPTSAKVQEWIRWHGRHDDAEPGENPWEQTAFIYAKHQDDDGKMHEPEWLVYDDEYPDEGVTPIGQHIHGRPGDRLWVRETWAHYQTLNMAHRPDGRAFDEISDGLAGYKGDGHESIEDFRAHVRLMSDCDLEDVIINGDRWRPSIHMPRWACRTVAEVKAAYFQPIQDITEEEAIAEGVERWSVGDNWWTNYTMSPEQAAVGYVPLTSARDSFRSLWIACYGQEAWDSNPMVYVTEFKRV